MSEGKRFKSMPCLLVDMEVTNIRPLEGFKGDLQRATLTFENEHSDTEQSHSVVLEDFAWGLKCILDGASCKPHAGCLFTDVDDGISVACGNTGFKLSEERAREVVEQYGS
jgi:hypothetical protein